MHTRRTSSPVDDHMRAGLLGFVAGLRSQYPLFVLAVAGNTGDFASHAQQPLGLFRSRKSLAVFAALALGELVGDKLPITPSRLNPPQLVVRLIMGALVGAAVSAEADRSVALGSLLGAIGSGAGSYAGNRFRAYYPELTDLPGIVGALSEDIAALELGWATIRLRTTT